MTERRHRCRSCDSGDLWPVLSLGSTPLANALLTKDELGGAERQFPLELVFCRACTLVQITETVPPAVLFSEYPYFSSFSDTMVSHAAALVERVARERNLGPSSLAAEVASNDGYLLQAYHRLGIPVLGIEPAKNIAGVAVERGVRTVCEFFGADVACRLRDQFGSADVIHANNVLAHVADLNGFVQGLAAFVSPTGAVIVEVPYVRDMVEHVEFDTIYHEHLCYFSLTALDGLFRRHGLGITAVERLPIHGGSLRVFAARDGHPDTRVQQLLEEERATGIADTAFYATFADRVQHLKGELTALIRSLRAAGKRIAAYGASAKGSTLLNYFEIGRDDIDFVVDRSTVKQGRYTPGTHLLIRPPEALVDEAPDYVLLLTWNFADEILKQQDAYRRAGGRFIVPVPAPAII